MMLQNNLDAFNRAISNSMKSDGAIQHGSVVINGGKVVGEGYNSKEIGKFKMGSICRHAEAASLLNYLSFSSNGKKSCFKACKEQKSEGLRSSYTNGRQQTHHC